MTRSATEGVVLHDNETGARTVIDAAATTASPLAMASNGDVVYSRANELYYYSRHSGESRKLTSSGGAESFAGLDISADSRTVVFTSGTKYVDGGTVNSAGATYGGATNIFSLNLESGIVRRVSATASAADLKVSEDGSKVSFYVDQGVVGQDMYVVDLGGAAPVQRLIAQPTEVGVASLVAGIANNGDLYFSSFSDLTGENSVGSSQIFKYSYSSNQLTQLSRANDAGFLTAAVLSADEGSVFFLGDSDFVGENSGKYTQVFRLDTATGAITQTTMNRDVKTYSIPASLSRDGSRVTYVNGTSLSTAQITSGALTLDIEAGTGAQGALRTALSAIEGTIRGLGGFSLNSRASALGALDALQIGRKNLGVFIGVLGAAASRLQSAASVIQDQAFQAGAARSRIVDADIAEESAAYVRTNVLRETSAAVLAQANQSPQLALRLLQI